jgi:hypothetical protein
MEIVIDHDDLHHVVVREDVPRPCSEGEVRLQVERFGLSANNITYAVMGDAMAYWQFFPTEAGNGVEWRTMPVWGFATVAESTLDQLPVGTKVFGYFPFATSLIVTPGRIDDAGFSDVAPHRAALPSVYNRYARCDADPMYDPAAEELLMLLRPLFITSYVVADFLTDHDVFGAGVAVISSASAKTAYGAAALLHAGGVVRTVGLTSPGNVAFCQSLGCYDAVLTYDQVAALEQVPTVYLDVAGRRDVTAEVHRHLLGNLAYSMIIGDTHWDGPAMEEGGIPGPKPTLLFAPVQIAKRRTEWGRDGFEAAVGAAWTATLPTFQAGIDLVERRGPNALVETYLALLRGEVDPRAGYICSFEASTD